MRSVRLSIEYEGTKYLGWQSQKSGATVQNTLREKLIEITGEDIRLTGASRTDSGVHALEQIAVFSTSSKLSSPTLMRALNAKLPYDIRILNAHDVSDSFHPRFDARSKIYMYIISTGSRSSAFFFKYVWRIPSCPDLSRMRDAALYLTGYHDFSSFRGSGCGARTAVRTIHRLDIEPVQDMQFMSVSVPGEFIRFRIQADAFLRHMVRNIVGSLVDVGRGKISPEDLREILEARDRTLAGPTAPACGLFLERVIY